MESSRRDLLRHPVSFAGAALATVAGLSILALFTSSLLGFEGGGPYVGILAYVLLPGVFVVGLVLMPVGLAMARRRRRRLAATGSTEPPLPILDFNRPRTRAIGLIFVALTTVNVLILAAASYKGLELMDSTQFCGSCHSVMDPEVTAHDRSPHARVACVACHIGPGASWFVKSKLSGTWQVISVTLGLYPRPIPTPVHNLRPARETCEQCHWPTKFVGDRLQILTHHDDDAASTPTKTVLLLHVGGSQGVRARGIHWHVDPAVKVRYLADAKREHIEEVELLDADGSRRVYKAKADPVADAHWREMDCVDCHNRPTHIYKSPEEEVNAALDSGRIDRTALPFAYREAVKALRQKYPTREAAMAGIAAQFEGFYAKSDPAHAAERRPALTAAVAELRAIWSRNVWPNMNIQWGTYVSFLGHGGAPPDPTVGCMRCHDGDHATSDGKVIPNDCDLCHNLLAQDEKDPAILKQLAP
ncbi:MAG TPA: NapC/NirT family cytochrome c [Anaeromyxobacteraceae bacterium]|nr:NapC/NirT family cytochrome c [Anaeromyxobacteraceae bacterium]